VHPQTAPLPPDSLVHCIMWLPNHTHNTSFLNHHSMWCLAHSGLLLFVENPDKVDVHEY